MKKLYKGIHAFQESYFKEEAEFFKRISQKHDPDVLFITCADSRVDPNLVTQSRPGEMFIIRNVGNIVPPYDSIKDKNSVAAAIEFALLVLKVKDIIVCGHSNCGAMKALCKDDLDDMPHLRDWLKTAAPVKEVVSAICSSSDTLPLRTLEEENILAQLENIQTYPIVAKALKSGEVFLHGWYYEILTGKVYVYNPHDDVFEDIVLKKMG